MRAEHADHAELFTLKANLGVIFRGPFEELNRMADHLEEYCAANGVTIAFKKASASRLFVKEDDGRYGDIRNGEQS